MSDTPRAAGASIPGVRPAVVMGSITRRHNHVYPATGMSTYYSAGRGGSRRASAESSPSDVTRRHTSGSPSYGSVSSASSQRRTDSPASTVSLSSEASSDFASAINSGTPKYRTMVKISSDSERDKLFPQPNGASGAVTVRHGGGQVAERGRDSPLTAADSSDSRVPAGGRTARADGRGVRTDDSAAPCDSPSPGVTGPQQTTATTPAPITANTCANAGRPGTSSQPLRAPRTPEETHNLSSLNRDQPNKVLVSEHEPNTQSTKTLSNQGIYRAENDRTNKQYPGTPSSYIRRDEKSSLQLGSHSNNNNGASAMALTHGIHGSYPYADYPSAGSNGVSGHGGINTQTPEMVLVDVSPPPPLPPRSRKSTASYGLLKHHAPINGSTGTQSDLSDSLDSETSSLNLETSSSFGFSQHKFHMDQQVPTDGAREVDLGDRGCEGEGPEGGGAGGHRNEAHPFLVGQRNVLKPDEPRETKIISSKGTVRGLKNLVRAGIATFAEKHDGFKNYREIDKGKLVVYTTSVMVVRDTYERCLQVRRILHTHMVKFEERDVFMSRENQRELNDRLGSDKQDVPQVFADGQHIGGFEELERMNETGELRRILTQFQRVSRTDSCAQCGGYRYVPCHACHGSKKSQNRNYFIDEFCALRCTNCDENGLVRCDVCENDDVITS